MRFLPKALVVWALFIPLAFLNKIIREQVLSNFISFNQMNLVSTITFAVLIVVATFLLIRFIRPGTVVNCLITGALWVALTAAFEFLVDPSVFGTNFKSFTSTFSINLSNLWFITLAALAFAPLLTFKSK